MQFFSARLLYIILVDDGKPRKINGYDETVIVFKAKDFKHAFKRALALGKKSEACYKNHRGQNVKWALVEILSLSPLVGRKIDGMEVDSEIRPIKSKKPIAYKTRFRPECSKLKRLICDFF